MNAYCCEGDAGSWPRAERLLIQLPLDGSSPLERVHRSAQFLASFGHTDEAHRVTELHRKHHQRIRFAAPGSAGCEVQRTTIYDAIHLGIRMQQQRGNPGPSVSWSRLGGIGWVENLRLALALRTHEHSRVLECLRSKAHLTNYDMACRLCLLARHYFLRGHLSRGLGLIRSAYRRLAKDESCDAELRRTECCGLQGMIALQEGKLDLAEDLFRTTIRMATELKHEQQIAYYRQELAVSYSRRGDFDEARALMCDLLDHLNATEPRSDAQRVRRAAIEISAAQMALDRGDVEAARQHYRVAHEAFAATTEPVIQGHLALLRARLLKEEGAARLPHALAEFQAAEHLFGGFGDGLILGLFRVSLHRAHALLRFGELDAAMTDVLRCLEYARERRYFPARAAGLLLKTQLLLQKQGGAKVDSMYEEVLRGLGAIANPRILFRVVANLYLHTWDRQDDLELTQYHLDQLHELKRFFDARSYERLYTRYVTMPVLHRALAEGFGETPIEVAE